MTNSTSLPTTTPNLRSVFMSQSRVLKNLLLGGVAASMIASSATGVDIAPTLPSFKMGVGQPMGTTDENVAEQYSGADPRLLDSNNNPYSNQELFRNTDVAVEIRELARALKNDHRLIFNYVHDKIDYVPQFGFKKGALGAYLDQAGTSFDQALLLAQLLNEAGYTEVEIVVGTIQLTSSAELKAWVGGLNADAAVCSLLYDGGVPVDNCGSSTPKVYHAWVQAKVGETTTKFDPAFKQYQNYVPAFSNLSTEMGLSSVSATSGGDLTGGVVDVASSGTTSQNITLTDSNTVNISSINGVKNSDIQTHLNTLSHSLIDKITSESNSNYSLSIEELIGGREIVRRSDDDTSAFSASSATYTPIGSPFATTALPDYYRTIFKLEFRKEPASQFYAGQLESPAERVFFTDEIYGRRLTFDWTNTNSSTSSPNGAYLKFDDQPILSAILVNSNPADVTYTTDFISNGKSIGVTFSMDHPYAAGNGSYMDTAYERPLGGFSQPVTFVFGVGGPTSDMLTTKLAGERLRPTSKELAGTCQTEGEFDEGSPNPQQAIVQLIDTMKTQIGYGWLSQYTGALQLQEHVTKNRILHHHSFGMVGSSATWENVCPSGEGFLQIKNATGSSIQIDMVSGISAVASDNSDEDWQILQTASLLGNVLEGSVFQQYAGKVDVASTATRFNWFNNETLAQITAGNGVSDQQFFHVVDSTNADGLVPGPTIDRTVPTELGMSAPTSVQEFVDAGYIVVAPEGDALGPGVEKGYRAANGIYDYSYERGKALVAINPDSLEVTHFVSSGPGNLAKGGGAGEAQDGDEGFDPTKVADALRDQFEDRSRMHGIDLSSGNLSYSPPADVSTGAGDFPFALSFQRSFSAGGSRARGMGSGWNHNWAINASFGGSGSEALGKTKAVRATSTLVAMSVLHDLFSAVDPANSAADFATLKSVVVASSIGNWWGETLNQNVVTVNQGASVSQFYRLPTDPTPGTGEASMRFDPPKGSTASLSSTGTNLLPPAVDDYCADPNDGTSVEEYCSRIYAYDGVTLELNNTDGSFITFAERAVINGATSSLQPNVPPLQASRWDFASNLAINFVYSDDARSRLLSVESNLGDDSADTFNGPSLTFGWNNSEWLDTVTTNAGQASTFAYSTAGAVDGNNLNIQTQGTVFEAPQIGKPLLVSATNALSQTTDYVYVGNNVEVDNGAATEYNPDARTDWIPRLHEIYMPEYPDDASQRFDYDASWRVSDLLDGEGVLGNRGAWKFYVAPGYRGERVAPTVENHLSRDVNPTYTVFYNEDGLAEKFIDEAGRETTALYDGLDRVTERVFPSGIKSEFEYDYFHNVTLFRTTGKLGTVREVEAAYSDTNWPNNPTNVWDALDNETTITYYPPNSNGADGLPQSAGLPLVGGATENRYLFTYTTFGQPLSVTDPEDMVTTNTYYSESDSNGAIQGLLESTIVDSSGLALTTSFKYNTAGDQVEVDGPKGTDANGVDDLMVTEYDVLRRPIKSTDPIGNYKVPIYDENGRIIKVEAYDSSEALLQVSGQDFNNADDVIRSYSPECYDGTTLDRSLSACAETRTQYDAMGRATIVRDPDSRHTKTVYFESGEVYTVIQALNTSNQRRYQTYSYTSSGQVASVTDARDARTEYEYTEFDELKATYFPDRDMTNTANADDYEQYTYDANGNQTGKKTRKHDWIISTYDALNRVISKTVRQAILDADDLIIDAEDDSGTIENTVTYTYDLMGRDRLISQSGGTTTDGVPIPAHNIFYGYDTAGRMLCEIQDITTVPSSELCADYSEATHGGRAVGMDHDAAGARTQLVYPGAVSVTSKTINFTYDALGRMNTVAEGIQTLATYSHDALSRKTGLDYLGGASSSYSYHDDSAIHQIGHNFNGSGNDVT
ncbi:MAG: RHS repeat protein [Kordiimonadaceae bacterium]|nr:RHS repeat protein [Kordiimonadaceae bacterium]